MLTLARCCRRCQRDVALLRRCPWCRKERELTAVADRNPHLWDALQAIADDPTLTDEQKIARADAAFRAAEEAEG